MNEQQPFWSVGKISDVPRTAVGPTLSSKRTTTMANLNTVSAFLSLRTPPPSALAFSAPLRFSNKFLSRFCSSLRSPAISSKAKGCVWWGRRRAPFFTHSPFQICCKWCKLFSHNFSMDQQTFFSNVKKVAFHFFLFTFECARSLWRCKFETNKIWSIMQVYLLPTHSYLPVWSQFILFALLKLLLWKVRGAKIALLNKENNHFVQFWCSNFKMVFMKDFKSLKKWNRKQADRVILCF